MISQWSKFVQEKDHFPDNSSLITYFVLLDKIYGYLPAKMLLEIRTVRTFVKYMSILDEELFSEASVGSNALYFVKVIWCSRLFCTPPPNSLEAMNCFFAVAGGWMLLDFGWFVLFMFFICQKITDEVSFPEKRIWSILLHVIPYNNGAYIFCRNMYLYCITLYRWTNPSIWTTLLD